MATSSFAALLRHHRLAVGLTQEELAERAGLSGRAISDLERGLKQAPRPSTVRLLVRGLGLPEAEAAALLHAAQPRRDAVTETRLNDDRHTLPRPLSSFVGRERELKAVRRLLERDRLVTLTGAGGIGKTRLAVQTAADLMDQYADGAALVDLAPLAQPELVDHAVANAVGVREEPGQPMLETLASALRSRQFLLVLDNCEHLIQACARVSDTLIRACPRVHILVTSREPLGITGAATWRVAPLETADPRHMPPLDSLTQYEAVQLLKDRAGAVQPTFDVTLRNAPAVAEICHRLDGIPLAIELAAARMRVLTADQIAERLADRFRLLIGGSRTAMPRHQTLRALVDWSHELLSDDEKVLFRRVSVFAGGWTLGAAETVCAGEPIERGDVLELLNALVDKSLVLADEQANGQMRYRLLETLREYAAKRLADAGEEAVLLQQHATYFLDQIERIDHMRETAWPRWRREGWPWHLAEQDNLRAVLGACRDGSVDANGHAEIGLRLCAGLWWFWVIHDRANEAWNWHLSLLEMTPARPSSARFWATWYAGITAGGLAQFEQSERLLGEARAVARTLRDDQAIALADGATGEDFLWQGRLAEAEEACERALSLGRQAGPRCYLPIFLYNCGWTALRQGRLERAVLALDESVAVARELGDDWVLAVALPIRATVALLQDNLSEAEDYLQEAQRVVDDLPARGLGLPRLGLGQLALLQGDADRATTQFATALEDAAHSGVRFLTCESLQGLAFAASARGDEQMAAQLLAAEDLLRSSITQRRSSEDQQRVDATLKRVRDNLGNVEFEVAWQAGQHLSVDEAIAYARPLAPSMPADPAGCEAMNPP